MLGYLRISLDCFSEYSRWEWFVAIDVEIRAVNYTHHVRVRYEGADIIDVQLRGTSHRFNQLSQLEC